MLVGVCVVALAFMSLHIEPDDLPKSQGWVWACAILAMGCIFVQGIIQYREDHERDNKEEQRDALLAQMSKALETAVPVASSPSPPPSLAQFTTIDVTYPARQDESKKPKLSLIANTSPAKSWFKDPYLFELVHLGGDPAQNIEIEDIHSDRGGNLWIRFEPIPYLNSQRPSIKPNFWIDIAGRRVGEDSAGNARFVVFSRDATLQRKRIVSYPVSIQFRWDREIVNDKYLVTWSQIDERLRVSPA